MNESLEIVCVLRDSTSVPSPGELQQALDESEGYKAGIGGFDNIYLSDTDLENSVGVDLKIHDVDSDWYTLPSLPAITMRISAFQLNTGDFDERLQSVLKHVEYVYRSLDGCQYIYGLDEEHADAIVKDVSFGKDVGSGVPVSSSSLSEGRIEEVSWLMLFPPEMVQNYGRARLLSAPAWERRELDDGAIMLVVAPDPGDWDEFPEARQDVAAYLESTE